MSAIEDQVDANLLTLAHEAAQALAERGHAYADRGRSSMPVSLVEIGLLLTHYWTLTPSSVAVTDEAVDAAARSLVGVAIKSTVNQFDNLPERLKAQWRTRARAALDAAAAVDVPA